MSEYPSEIDVLNREAVRLADTGVAWTRPAMSETSTETERRCSHGILVAGRVVDAFHAERCAETAGQVPS